MINWKLHKQVGDGRAFYRCPDCLVIVTTEKAVPYGFFCDNCKTDLHSARFEFLGTVYQDKLVNLEDRCPCDERCTSARGPNCDCKCGGVNHGAGFDTVLVEVGGVPMATQAHKAAQNLGAWHCFNDRCEALELRAEQVFGEDFKRFLRRESINNRERYGDIYGVCAGLRKARALKSHAGRFASLDKTSAWLDHVADRGGSGSIANKAPASGAVQEGFNF